MFFFLDVDISQNCPFHNLILNYFLNVNQVLWVHALAVYKRIVWWKQSKLQAKQTNLRSQFQEAVQDQRMIAFAKQAFYFISTNAKLLYHPLSFSSTAQTL